MARWLLKFEDLPGIEFWADPKLLLRPRGLFVTSAADLLVAPDLRDFIEEAFRKARLTYEVLIDDVQVSNALCLPRCYKTEFLNWSLGCDSQRKPV